MCLDLQNTKLLATLILSNSLTDRWMPDKTLPVVEVDFLNQSVRTDQRNRYRQCPRIGIE
jgi:hypothetical protein